MLTAGSVFLPFVQQHVVSLDGDAASGVTLPAATVFTLVLRLKMPPR